MAEVLDVDSNPAGGEAALLASPKLSTTSWPGGDHERPLLEVAPSVALRFAHGGSPGELFTAVLSGRTLPLSLLKLLSLRPLVAGLPVSIACRSASASQRGARCYAAAP